MKPTKYPLPVFLDRPSCLLFESVPRLHSSPLGTSGSGCQTPMSWLWHRFLLKIPNQVFPSDLLLSPFLPTLPNFPQLSSWTSGHKTSILSAGIYPRPHSLLLQNDKTPMQPNQSSCPPKVWLRVRRKTESFIPEAVFSISMPQVF